MATQHQSGPRETSHARARQTNRRSAYQCLEPLERRALLSAALIDVNPGSASSDPSSLTDVHGTAFFTAQDSTHARGLWKSDGATATLLKPGSSFSVVPQSLTNVNGTLFFSAADADHGWELWKSDGTPEGTVIVKDIIPGIGGSVPFSLTNVNGTLFFVAEDASVGGANGRELWKSDGTADGTLMVKDIRPGSLGSNLENLVNANGTLFFAADDGVHGRELWKSDGTPAGTTLVKDVNVGGSSSFPSYLTNVNGTIYFAANNGQQLWTSDGTPDGTTLVANFPYGPSQLTSVGNTLYFEAIDEFSNVNLWKSDGTPSGTVMIRDVKPVSADPGAGQLVNVNGTLYLTILDPQLGVELWKSDGTAGGTVMVKDVQPGYGSGLGFYSFAGYLTNVHGQLFFAGNDGIHGAEPWTSDGTAAGTSMIQDIFPGDGSSGTSALTDVDGSLYFKANDRGVHGYELWRVSQVLQDDAAKTAQGVPVTINVLANDFVAASAGGAVVASLPAHGSVVVNSDGTVTYTSAADYSGTDSFIYTVTNRFGDVDTAIVRVNVFQPVQIDIKPGSAANAINLNNDGTITVGVISTPSFDATTVDVASVRFADAAPIGSSLEDFNGDGRTDLELRFRIADTSLTSLYSQLLAADASDGTLSTTRQPTTLLLIGGTTSGGVWEGLDAATLFESGKALNDLLGNLALAT